MKPLLLFLLLLLPASGTAQQTQSSFRFGERPKNSVFDPAGVLTIAQQAQIAGPLAEVLANEGIDVMVVILPEIGDAPPVHTAEGFAEKWATADVNAVVLHVPGREGSPWIFPGKVMESVLNLGTMKESIENAQKRAGAEPTDFGKVRAASIEASDALRYWMGSLRIRSEEMISERLKARLEYERRQRLLKLAAILAGASAIPILVGAVFFILNYKNNRPRHFPTVRITPRLGAPYSGGNNAVTKSI